MNVKKIYLKIKAKSLAEEARMIRKEEQKLKQIPFYKRKIMTKYNWGWLTEDPVTGLAEHRKWDVRNEARATHIARTYIAGHEYRRAEKKCNDFWFREVYILPRVVKLIEKYGEKKITREEVKRWIDRTDSLV